MDQNQHQKPSERDSEPPPYPSNAIDAALSPQTLLLSYGKLVVQVGTNPEDHFDVDLKTFCKRSAAFKKLQEVLQKGARVKDAATDSKSAPGVFTDLLRYKDPTLQRPLFQISSPKYSRITFASLTKASFRHV
ncbi:hypothetical protein LTS18_006109, partial [Coniosporium uncinatum]